MTISKSKDEIKQAVREHYAKAITTSSGCCGSKPVNFSEEAAGKYVALAGYSEKEMQGLPEGVTTLS